MAANRLFNALTTCTIFGRQIRKVTTVKSSTLLQAVCIKQRAIHVQSSATILLCQQTSEDHLTINRSLKHTEESGRDTYTVRNHLPVPRDPLSAPKTLPRGQTVSLGYQMKPFWEGYVRNFKGAIPPLKTRKRCTRGKNKVCGNPCPICRDHVRVHYKETELLKQFICPYSGKILEPKITGLCRQQHKRIVQAIQSARNHGYLPYVIPRRLPKKELRVAPWNKVDIR